MISPAIKNIIISIGLFASLSVHAKLSELLKYVSSEENGHKTKSFIIYQNGKTIFDYHHKDFGPLKIQRIWSVSKSITSILIGIANYKGLIDIHSPVKKYFPQINSSTLSIKHLLEMSSGLEWKESYEKDPTKSDVIRMLYIDRYQDMSGFVASKNQSHTPGAFWYYSSGESNLLMGTLQRGIGDIYEDFPWNELFGKLDFQGTVWERDHTNNYIASSYLYMRPIDMIKIGVLMLNHGVWKGERLLAADWVKYSTTLNQAFKKNGLQTEDGPGYGAHWWLNINSDNENVFHPQAPKDTFMALGHHGQFIIVIPSQKMVIVRTGEDKKGTFDRNKMFQELEGL